MADYHCLTVTSEGCHFSIFCTSDSLERRRDEIILWADQLASRLKWSEYDIAITDSSQAQATAREHALFENRFPAE